MKRKILILPCLLWLAAAFTACEDNGLRQGDPDYWTVSRHQFTVPLENGQTLYLLDNQDGTATVTFDGANPRHVTGDVDVNITTYVDTLVIPETVTHEGKTLRVTAVGEEAFMGNRALLRVELPASVQSIGQGAFCYCRGLLDVNIPDGITEIPSAAFAQCVALDTIILPESVEILGKMAFYYCPNVKEMWIGANVKSMGYNLFYNWKGNIHIACTTPPALDGAVNIAQTTPQFYVPADALSAYMSAEGWQDQYIDVEPEEEDEL